MLIQVPHFGDTVQVSHCGGTVQVPHCGNTVQVAHFGDTVQVPHFGDTLQVPQFCATVQFRHQNIRTGVVLLNLFKIQMPFEPTPDIEISIPILVFHHHDRFCSERQVPVPRGSFHSRFRLQLARGPHNDAAIP
jgi:hypothetical protein